MPLTFQVRPERLYDPKIGAWICNPELESYEYIELLNYFLKHVEKDRIESNVNVRFLLFLLLVENGCRYASLF